MNKIIISLIFLFLVSACTSIGHEPTLLPTSTEIPTPSMPTKTPVVYPDYESGQVICHDSIEEFGYEYCSYVPRDLASYEKAYILLEISHGQFDDYEETIASARRNVENYVRISEEYKYIILTPAIPRNFEKGYYPQGINEYSMKSTTPEFYYRPDLKVNLIIEQFSNELREAGYQIEEQIFVAGFSAGGMWANRYTLLYPERVEAAAIGHSGGWLVMPISNYQNSNLNWPLGLNNFANLIGEEYNKFEELKDTPMFIFIGDQDTESTYWSNYPNRYDISIWGDSNPERLKNQFGYLKDSGYDVKFKMYQNIGHSYNDQMRNDVFEFFEQYKD